MVRMDQLAYPLRKPRNGLFVFTLGLCLTSVLMASTETPPESALTAPLTSEAQTPPPPPNAQLVLPPADDRGLDQARKNSPASPPEDSLSEGTGKSKLSIPKRRIKLFSYHDLRPHWGLQLETSFNPFGGNILGGAAVIPQQGTTPSYGIDLAFEFQPSFLQSIGVIGIGPRVGIYPIFGGGVTSSVASIYSFGGQIRYQARYFRRQLIVPMAAYSLESFNYSFTTGQTGNFWAKGPTWGFWILLNTLDPESAADFYIDNGIARTYLVMESRILSGADSVVTFASASYYFGLRFEF